MLDIFHWKLEADKHVIIFTRDTITGVLGGCSIVTRSGLGWEGSGGEEVVLQCSSVFWLHITLNTHAGYQL